MKSSLLVVLVFCSAAASWGQDRAALVALAQNPQTVVDYFISCPYLLYHQDDPVEPGDEGHWIQVAQEKPWTDLAGNLLAKSLLLQGVPADLRFPVRGLVVDVKNGYLRFRVGDQELTLVYFEKADKSRLVAYRVANLSGPDIDASWFFFAVSGGVWTRLDDQDVLPLGWETTYLNRTPTAFDRDALALTSWDLDLPQFGTTARLIPLAYSDDGMSRSSQVTIPGTKRTMRLRTYFDWLHPTFADEENHPRALELKWNKARGRFDAGKVAQWVEAPQPQGRVRPIFDVLHHPQNIWEIFLANPNLAYDSEAGLYWDPELGVPDEEYRDSEQDGESPYLSKQELLGWESLGVLVPRNDRSIVVDLANNYLALDLRRLGPGAESQTVEKASLTLEMKRFTSAKGPVVGYRFWGRSGSDAPQPRYESNQIAAVFYTFTATGEPSRLEDAEVFPLDEMNQLILSGTTAEQALQKAIVWDVKFPRSGTTIELVPWPSKGDSFAANKAVALDWDPETGRFHSPRFISRKP